MRLILKHNYKLIHKKCIYLFKTNTESKLTDPRDKQLGFMQARVYTFHERSCIAIIRH